MGRATSIFGWNRAAFAVALAYLLVLKSIVAPLTASVSPFDGRPVWTVICHTDAPDGSSGQRPDGSHSCCDDGCLMRVAAFAAPLLLVTFLVVLRRIVPLVARPPLAEARGPPIEAWAPVRAQRGPPIPFNA